jgi:uncharacterized membrane protein YedE/YeeE
MVIENFTPLPSLVGGLMIGGASALMMLFTGKIAGISGITKGVISDDCKTSQERNWRISFLTGLLLGGFLIAQMMPNLTAKVASLNYLQMVIAGLLVGIGTSLGNGCTSGHGICGLARRSPRSLASVVTFMAFGFITVYVLFHVLGFGG